ncbi:unnamed protein product, partial [Prorocentrum cordatum]
MAARPPPAMAGPALLKLPPLAATTTSLSALKLAAEPLAWLLVPASRSLTPLCVVFVLAKWLRTLATQGPGAVLRRGARHLWRALLTAEIWFAVYTLLVARSCSGPGGRCRRCRGTRWRSCG